MAVAAVMLGFSAATSGILTIDAYRIESAEPDLQALMSATYIAGYRIGMLVSGAGSLFIADWLGSNRDDYLYQAWAINLLAYGNGDVGWCVDDINYTRARKAISN